MVTIHSLSAPEVTQLDLEMSFVDADDIMNLIDARACREQASCHNSVPDCSVGVKFFIISALIPIFWL
jgi:aspartyl-tRNA synthetase